MGHHSQGPKRTMFAYGRDEQAGPVKSYEECVSSIRAGTFRPDQSRSGVVIVAIYLNPSDSSYEALNAAPAPRPQATECLDEDGNQEDGALHTCVRCGGTHSAVQCPKRPK